MSVSCWNPDTLDVIYSSYNCEIDKEMRCKNLVHWLSVPPSFTTLRLNLQHSTADNIELQIKQAVDVQCEKKGFELFKIWQHPALKDCIIIKNRTCKEAIVPASKEVIVDMICGMAVMRGADVFAQGIMGAPTNMSKGDLVSVYCDMDGKCRKGLTQKYDKKKSFIGNGIAQLGRDEFFCSDVKISGVGILMTQPLMEAPCLDFLPHLVFAQNLPSIVCGHVLDPQPGDIILDMCAAPGGKTVHIASLLKNKGRVIALDKAKGKVDKIRSNLKDWGLENIVDCYYFDARNALKPDPQSHSSIEDGPPYCKSTFDRILLDGPCSALGQRPTLHNNMVPNVLNSFPKYQKQLIRTAVELLKPGGVLVYSTCTVPVEENEEQVEWILKNFTNLQLVPQNIHVGGYGLKGKTSLSEDQLKLLQRFDISCLTEENLNCDNDTIGFFIAKFIKN